MKRTVWVLIGILLLSGCAPREKVEESTISTITTTVAVSSSTASSLTKAETTAKTTITATSTTTTQPAEPQITTTAVLTTSTSAKQTTIAGKEKITTIGTTTAIPVSATALTTVVTTPTSTLPETTTITAQTPSPTTTTAIPEFDVNHWLEMGKAYAREVGLEVDPDAVYCWDNPIQAGSHCRYLERDIKGRLTRYAADEEIKAVWLWAEPLDDGIYQIFIGYA